jgi:hypothetical protein
MMVHAVSGFVLWWGWLHFSLSFSWSNVMKERLEQEAMSFIAENKSWFAHADEITESVNIACAPVATQIPPPVATPNSSTLSRCRRA